MAKLKLFLWLLMLFLLFDNSAYAKQIVILKTNDLQLYKKTTEAFKNTMSAHDIKELSLKGDASLVEPIANQINTMKPDAIFILGALALNTYIEKIDHSIPGIYTFVLGTNEQTKDLKLSKISMEVPLSVFLAQASLFIPGQKKVALVASSKEYLDIQTKGLNYETNKVIVESNEDLINKIQSQHFNDCQSIWLSTDPKFMSFMSIADFTKIAQVSKQNKKPLLVFSEAFVKAGGLISISINYETLGNQAASVINKNFSTNTWEQEDLRPIGTNLVFNKSVAKELNLIIQNENLRMLADIVIED